MRSEAKWVCAGGHRLEVVEYAARQAARPTLVLLHEGLGSVAMWRGFPAEVARVTGCRTVVYSRYGYGQSDPLETPRQPDYLHHEAREVLPEVLAALAIEKPVLIGHSDGGSITLIHAGSGCAVAGLIVMAPHCFVEDLTIHGIEEAGRAARNTDLLARLARFHRDSRKTFQGWHDIWLHPDFRAWNIEDVLPAIRCPIIAIQGVGDEYGTMAQIEAITRGATGVEVELLALADCGHSPHKDQPEAVLNAIARLLDQLR